MKENWFNLIGQRFDIQIVIFANYTTEINSVNDLRVGYWS